MREKSDRLPADYARLLADIRQRVRYAQTSAMLAVNAELIRLYWEIGSLIDARQNKEGWGAGVIPRLARDLHNELPEEKGFSERNIKRMLAFYREYPHLEFVPRPVAQTGSPPKVPQAVAQMNDAKKRLAALFPPELILALPWGHHAELMSKVKEPTTRQWYMQAAIVNGWSRNILVMQIETSAHARLGRTASNFERRLPPPDSDLVKQTLKDPYIFDFLTLEAGFHERELETGLIAHCSLESVQGLDDPEQGIPGVIAALKSAIDRHPDLSFDFFEEDPDASIYNMALLHYLTRISQHFDKPLVILFDEIDCLTNGTLIAFLYQLREGYVRVD